MNTDNFSAVAVGVGTKNAAGDWLEVFYPAPVFRPAPDTVAAMATAAGYKGGNAAIELDDESTARLAAACDDVARPLVEKMIQKIIQV